MEVQILEDYHCNINLTLVDVLGCRNSFTEIEAEQRLHGWMGFDVSVCKWTHWLTNKSLRTCRVYRILQLYWYTADNKSSRESIQPLCFLESDILQDIKHLLVGQSGGTVDDLYLNNDIWPAFVFTLGIYKGSRYLKSAGLWLDFNKQIKHQQTPALIDFSATWGSITNTGLHFFF